MLFCQDCAKHRRTIRTEFMFSPTYELNKENPPPPCDWCRLCREATCFDCIKTLSWKNSTKDKRWIQIIEPICKKCIGKIKEQPSKYKHRLSSLKSLKFIPKKIVWNF